MRLCCLYLTVHRLPLSTENLVRINRIDTLNELTRLVGKYSIQFSGLNVYTVNVFCLSIRIQPIQGVVPPPLHVPLTCKLILKCDDSRRPGDEWGRLERKNGEHFIPTMNINSLILFLKLILNCAILNLCKAFLRLQLLYNNIIY